MPRRAKPARLWLRPAAEDRSAVWVIKDRGKQYSTGCGPHEGAEAERRLTEHIAAKHNPVAPRIRHASQTLIADVLSVYIDEAVPRQARPKAAAERVDRLLDYWGTRMLSEVTPATCRAYAEHRRITEQERRAGQRKNKGPPKGRVSGGGARRDLEDLRAAVNHHAQRELHTGHVAVELPPKGKPRTVWLTRNEVAALLWACWRHKRPVRLPRGSRKGAIVTSERHDLRHVARFILMAVYTASRSGAIFTASIHAGANRSFIDLDSGLFYRLREGARETAKRQPPVPLPDRLRAHIERWKRRNVIAQYVVEWEGLPVASVKTGLATAVRLAGIGKHVSPHSFRHTAVTWMLQNGVPVWDAAGFAGMSEAMVRNVYGHHCADHLRIAAQGIAGKRKALAR